MEVSGRVVVMGDEAALRQVIANLITNSLRHTPRQATITIRAFTAGNRVTVDVVDSGPGMTPTKPARPSTASGEPMPAGHGRVPGSGLRSLPGSWLPTTEPSPLTPVVIVEPRSPSDSRRPERTARARLATGQRYSPHLALR